MPQVGQPFVHVVARSTLMPPLLLRISDYRALLTVVCQALERYPTRLLAYAMLPNHWELILGPSDSTHTRGLARWVIATHDRRLQSLRRLARDGRAYQEPSVVREIRSAHELVQTCRLVERRALDARLVSRAQDWPWGSLADRFRLLRHLPLARAPFLASDSWLTHVNHPGPPERLTASRSGHLSQYPGRLADRLERPNQSRGLISGGDHDQTHTHVEGAKHFWFRHPSCRL